MKNKIYLVCDVNDCEFNRLMNYEELLSLLLNELEDDTINCYENDNFEGVKYNINLYKSFAKEHYQINEVIKQLEPFGWSVMDLTQLQRDLSNYQAYKNGVGVPIIKQDCIEETLKMIESEMK